MAPQLTYFAILAGSIAGPLALSFDKKVAFYKNWKALFIAIPLPALFFILWDSWFVSKGNWGFAADRNVGFYIGNLIIEEILFFVLIPYCCVFVYECMVAYFPQIQGKDWGNKALATIAILLAIIGLVNLNKDYTRDYALLNALFITIVLLFKKHRWFISFDSSAFVISYLVMLIPFMVVNGLLTAIPVIWYNHAENLNTRMYTIPIEDTYYGMLQILMIVVAYVFWKNKFKK